MSKLKIYQWSTWVLLLLNVAMIALFFLTKPKHPNNEPLRQSAKTEMNLTDQQYNLFKQSARKHQAQIQQLNDEQNRLLQLYFGNLASNEVVKNDSLLGQLQNIEKQKISITYEHFREIKTLLKPEQYPAYEAFVQRAISRILKLDKKGPPSPKD
jgi:hypothetical protein